MFAYITTMRLRIKQTLPATRIAFQDRKLDEAVVTDGGKQEPIVQEKVDVAKSALEDDAINQHEAVKDDINEDTVEVDAAEATTVEEQHNIRPLTPEEVTKTKDKVARELYEEIYSNRKVVVENITEKVTEMKDKVARMLYKGNCSKEKFSKSAENKAANRVNYMELDNGVQYKEMMDTGQYNTVVDVMDKEVVMMVPYIDLDVTASR